MFHIGHAKAGGERDAFAAGVSDRLSQSLSQSERCCGRGIRQDDGELFAADACDHVDTSCPLHQYPTNGAQNPLHEKQVSVRAVREVARQEFTNIAMMEKGGC